MSNKKSLEAHLQYLELEQDSIFELRKGKDILEQAVDDMSGNSCACLTEETEINSFSYEILETDQIGSLSVTLNQC